MGGATATRRNYVEQPRFGLTYEDYNRLMVAPLALLLLGAFGLNARYAEHFTG